MNISENFIAEKALNESEPWEFGYALGVSRPLALAASGRPCVFCRENFAAGAELYGGLGDLDGFGLRATSHYAGPAFAFNIPRGPTISFSPELGAQCQQRGSHLPHQALVRAATNLGLVPPGYTMKRRGPGFVVGMMLGAVLLSAAVDNSWLERVPEADRKRTNPFAGQAEAVSAGAKLFGDHCAKCHGSDALGRGKRPSLRSSVVQQAADGQLFWFLRKRQLAPRDAVLEFFARTVALANHRLSEKPGRAGRRGCEHSAKRA